MARTPPPLRKAVTTAASNFGRYRVRVRDDRHIPVARVLAAALMAAPRLHGPSVAEIDAPAEPFEIRTDDLPRLLTELVSAPPRHERDDLHNSHAPMILCG